MADVDVTCREAAALLDAPLMTPRQIATLTWIHVIPVLGTRRTSRRGRPARTYDLGAIKRAHACEAARTAKQFTDNDWIGSALLGLDLIRVDAVAGEIRWLNGERAERLNSDNYGYVDTTGDERCAAHRIIWIAADGEIPPGMQINHINKLRWDNRRANLEIVSFGNNIRHAYGKPYLTYHQAVRQLAELPPPPSDSEALAARTILSGGKRAGGAFRRS
jgi:hypothetical protein